MDGLALARAKKVEIARRVSELAAHRVEVGLGTLIVGDDPGSHSYVAGKHRDCAEVGIRSIRQELPAQATQARLLEAIEQLNEDPSVTGFIVQLPLPEAMNPDEALAMVRPDKDADGLHPFNLGSMLLGAPAPRPCTPKAVVALLAEYQVNTQGARVVIIGRGTTVGRPLSVLLSQSPFDSTVTVCHSRTQGLQQIACEADILIAAVGRPHFVSPEMVKPGACVIDVGLTRTSAGLIGDVAPGVDAVAGFITPVPGGVGPMTRAMLLENVVELAEHREESRS